MEATINVNSILSLLKNMDLNVQEYISGELLKYIKKNKKNVSKQSKAKEMNEEDKRTEILNSACGIWDWDENDYPTEELIADIKNSSDWKKREEKLMNVMFDHND